MQKPNSFAVGAAAASVLMLLYVGILALAESPAYAWQQFLTMPVWLSLLWAGFGVQIGLLHRIKVFLRQQSAGATAGAAASGCVSTAAMVACCAHHVADVLPVIGLAGAAVFLAEYQSAFVLLGVFSNLVGIAMMLTIIQKHGLHPATGVVGAIFAFDMRRVRNALAIFTVVAVPVYFFVFGLNAAPLAREDAVIAESLDLPEKSNDEKAVSIKVTPKDVAFGKPVRFRISMNTHSVPLDFDLAAISVLKDDRGTVFKPTGWKGSPPGGHHRSGTLSFPVLPAGTKAITLTIRDVDGVRERNFEWPLR